MLLFNKDKDINYSDIPELDDDFWKKAKIQKPLIKSKITILSRFPDRFLSQFPECDIEDISWCTGDIADYTFPEDNFDYILHMARSYAAYSVKDPITQFYSIVIGTKQILEMALRCSNCKVLFISSGAVYGEYSHKVSENLPSTIASSFINPSCR